MSFKSALDLIESVADDRVLFAGETIRDVYRYVSPLGRPRKELILSTELQGEEAFNGGILAAVGHASTFCAWVDVWSDRTITKTRYVEQAYFRKLFQVQTGIVTTGAAKPVGINEYDAVCVVDYGHGMMREQYAVELQDEAAWLAVAVQTNSANYGFNLATKYDRCDYLVVDDLEARLATQNQDGPIEASLTELSAIAPKVVITRGNKGSIGWSKESGIVTVPSTTPRVVDTLGAGDAFFAITAPMSREGSIADLLFIGNTAGGLAAQIVGHRQHVTKAALIARIMELP